VWTSIRTRSSVLKIVSVDGDWEGRSEEDERESVRRAKIHRCGGRKRHGTLKIRLQVDCAASSQESPF